LRIADEGKERFVDGRRGRIDILAEDDQGLVVIELKANEAPETAITQVLYYVGALARETSRPVRGVLVAHEFSDRVKFAAEAGRVRLVKYEHRFSFSEAELDPRCLRAATAPNLTDPHGRQGPVGGWLQVPYFLADSK